MPVTLHLAPKPHKESKRSKETEKDPFLPDTESGATPASVGKKRRILVADDNPVVLKAFEMKLKASGFIVLTTTDAATVASKADEENVDLVIVDIHFPGGGAMQWDGFGIIQWMRRFPELAHVPVIIITGGEASKFRHRALAAGARAFFTKPVEFKELLAAILEALGG